MLNKHHIMQSVFILFVQVCIGMWKEQLPSLQVEGGCPNTVRIRSTIEGAVSFWQDWLKRMHDRWDEKESLVLEPRVEYTTLPPTAYADTVPRPAALSDAEVTPYILSSSWAVVFTVLLARFCL